MNQVMMQAFFDELEKIADWSLAGPALGQHSAESLAAGGPHGTHTSPAQLAQTIQSKEMATTAGRNAGAMREAKMNEMLQSGQWNPKTHNVDQAGNLVPRKQHTYPTAQPRVDRSAATAISGRPMNPSAAAGRAVPGHVPTQIVSRGAIGGAPRAAAAGGSLLRRGLSAAGRLGGKVGKVGLGLGALGLAGAGGYEAGHQPAPAMG